VSSFRCVVPGFGHRKRSRRSEDLVDGVAEMLEFVVQIVAVVLEPVLKAFKEVFRETGAVARRGTMGADGLDCHQSFDTRNQCRLAMSDGPLVS